MANLYDRILYTGDFFEDGGPLNLWILSCSLRLFQRGEMTALEVQTVNGCSLQQGADLQQILDTVPNPAFEKATWADRCYSLCYLAQEQVLNGTEAELRAKLGVAATTP